MQQFEVVRAVFRPARVDDLKPGAVAMIGREGEWMAGWVIEDEPYAGQWAMSANGLEWSHECARAGFCWVPESDLAQAASLKGGE